VPRIQRFFCIQAYPGLMAGLILFMHYHSPFPKLLCTVDHPRQSSEESKPLQNLKIYIACSPRKMVKLAERLMKVIRNHYSKKQIAGSYRE
jgi:hypothetical protein